jgi:hypothetical protein
MDAIVAANTTEADKNLPHGVSGVKKLAKPFNLEEKIMRLVIKDSFGLTETAILPVKRERQLQVIQSKNQTHYATKEGKLLLSVDNLDRCVAFADPCVFVEHRIADKVQRFQGAFITLKPL